MFGTLGTWRGISGRAWLGTAALHGLAIALVLTATHKPLPTKSQDIISIELVELRLDTPIDLIEEIDPVLEEPAPELPDEKPEPEPDSEPDSGPDPEITVEDAVPKPLPSEPSAAIAVAPPPAVSAPAERVEDDEVDDKIPPQYLIRRDPLLEVAPSGAARVSAAVMCARTNRQTRPAFCPDIDDEDVRFALLARAQGVRDGYSPRDETLFADTTFDDYARANRYETFRDRQERFRALGSTGGSPIVRQGVHVPRHAEGLKNCTPVRTGIARTGGVDGLSPELTNGSEVFCD